MTRRVVVTGGAVVTALGCELPEFWDNLCAGKSGIGPLQRFDTADFKVKFGGEVSHFNPSDHLDIDAREVRRLDRFCQFAMVAAHKAIKHSGINFEEGDPYKHGVLIGSGELTRTLMKHNLIDRYMLLIHPLVLGSGRRLFPDAGPYATLRLLDTTPTTTGVVIATYEAVVPPEGVPPRTA